MLSEHGPARLQVSSPSANDVAIMRVLRAELGIDLMSAKAELRRVVNGDCSGTLPEMERAARKLREPGVAAAATHPWLVPFLLISNGVPNDVSSKPSSACIWPAQTEDGKRSVREPRGGGTGLPLHAGLKESVQQRTPPLTKGV
ncbi:hypothetical protein ACFQ7G_07110 [Streptomyces massasporeus]